MIDTNNPAMKSLFKTYTIAFYLLFASSSLNAQAVLQIDSLIGLPDTAFGGVAYPVSVQVSNTGNAPYQGGIQIAIQVDSSFDFLIANALSVLLLPGDSLLLSNPAGYIFDSSIFKPGNNVVVVWPYVPSPASIDTLYTNVFYVTGSISNVDEYPGKTFALYPNPASESVQIKGIGNNFEYVRIIDTNGRIVYAAPFHSDAPISLDGIPSGVYLFLIENKEGKLLRQKLILY